VAAQSSKRSRKRRSRATAPRAVTSQRREQRAERQVQASREQRRSQRTLGTVGERPPSPFGGVPVAEIAIFGGLVALVVWFVRGGLATLIVGVAVCALGVLEVTAREHFSGYRSHTTLLAGVPAIGVAIAVLAATGAKRDRGPLLIVIAGPLFGLLFLPLRRRFMVARQARLARPPAP
jgi:Flp pilus assembly protein TadB